jgi:hypothetical protein
MKGLRDILVPYSVRKMILHQLSAFDVAKLDEVLQGTLDDFERKNYLDPLRDLFWDVPEANLLLQDGMQLFLFGDDVSALSERLINTREYLNRHGSRRKRLNFSF